MSQQNKSTLQSAINSQLADNTSGDISAADVRDNLINMTDSLLFNSGSQDITGSLTATSFTGSLQGTATTASYVVTAQTASYVTTAATASYVLPTSPASVLVAVDGIGSDFVSSSANTYKEYLIPANTLTTSSILEVEVGIVKDTSNGATNVYLFLSSSLASNTLASATLNTNQTYSPLWRNFAISGSSIISLTPNSTAATDAVVSTLAITSSSIDTTIDNYLLVITLTPGSNAISRLLYCRITAHK